MKIRTAGGKILIHTSGGYPPVNDIGYDPNEKESKKVSEVGILKKDPETNREQIEKLEMMKADGGLDKARKHEKMCVDTSYLFSKKRKESSSSSSSSPDPCPTYLGPAFVKKVPSKGEAPVQPPWTTTETDDCRESGESETFTARGPRIPLPSSSVESSLSKSELKEGRLAAPPPPHPPPPSLPDSGELASANDDTTLPPSLPLPPLPPIPPKPATDSGQPFLPPQSSGPPPPIQPPALTARAALFHLLPQPSGPPPPKEPPALTAHATLPPSPKSTQPSPLGMGKSEREKVHDASSDIRNPMSNLASAVHTPPSPPPKLPPMLANHQPGGAPSQSTGANDAFRNIQPTLPGVGLPNQSFKPPPPQKTTLLSRTTPSSSRPTKTVITSPSAEWRKIDMEAVRSILLLAKSHMNGFIARSQGRDRAIDSLVERIRKRLLMYEFPTNEVDAFYEEWRGHMATFERLSARDEEAIVTEERARRLEEVQEQATKAQSERDAHLQQREFFKDNSRVAAKKLKAAEDRVSKLKHLLEEARKTVVIYKKVVEDLEQETSTANSKLEVAEKSVADKTSELKLVSDNIGADSETRAIHQQKLEEVKIDILACIQAFIESAWVKSFIQA